MLFLASSIATLFEQQNASGTTASSSTAALAPATTGPIASSSSTMVASTSATATAAETALLALLVLLDSFDDFVGDAEVLDLFSLSSGQLPGKNRGKETIAT